MLLDSLKYSSVIFLELVKLNAVTTRVKRGGFFTTTRVKRGGFATSKHPESVEPPLGNLIRRERVDRDKCIFMRKVNICGQKRDISTGAESIHLYRTSSM